MEPAQTGKNLEKLAAKLAGLFGEPESAYVAPDLAKPPDAHISKADLAKEFHISMVDLYKRSNGEIGYNPTRFAQMLSSRGGLDTARYLIGSDKPSDGYVTLWEHSRLDLSVEFVACSLRYRSLFSDSEFNRARRRLKDWGLDPDEYF